jgi:hypothetical protein
MEGIMKIKQLIYAAVIGLISFNAYSGINIIFKNNDNRAKYFAFSKSNNNKNWLNLNNSSWGESQFAPEYQLEVGPDSISNPVSIPGFKGGCRIFIFDEYYGGGIAVSGRPDLATDKVLYDKIEGGEPGAIWNQTSVDFFAIPVQLSKGKLKVGFISTATAELINEELGKLSSPYNKLKVSQSGVKVPRLFSPLKGADWIKDFENWSDDKIPDLLASVAGYKGYPIVYNGQEYTFSEAKGNTIKCNGNTTVALTGKQVLQNSYPDQPGALLSSAMLRGVLGEVEKWGNWSNGNKNKPDDMDKYYKTEPHNAYCRVLHKYGLDRKIYAMPYDDYFHNEASIPVNEGETLTITVLPLRKGEVQDKEEGEL